jgi:hypothetical protein
MQTPLRRQQAQTFLGQVYQDVMGGISSLLPERVKAGARASMELASPEARREVRDESGERILSSISNYSTFSPKFKKELKDVKGISLRETPQEFIGAYAARLLTDVGTDSTRHIYWRYNHPMAIADKAIEKVAGAPYKQLDPTRKALVGLAVGAPTAASLGTFDITNPGELFRAKGFSQAYPEVGAEDRRETAQPGLELVERMFLGRQGRPLKYETAKQDIPDLTPERYRQYMKGFYQDKGVTGLGLVKFTPENLRGEPEARIVGFPVGLQALGAATGGALALRQSLKPQRTPETIGGKERQIRKPEVIGTQEVQRVSRGMGKPQEIVRVKPASARVAAGLTLAGSLAGALTGHVVNRAVASMNNNPERLPDTLEYQQRM